MRSEPVSDYFVLRHDVLYERSPDGSEKKIAWLGKPVPKAGPRLLTVLRRDSLADHQARVAVSRDGRSVVYYAPGKKHEPVIGFHRYVFGRGDSLLHGGDDIRKWLVSVGDVTVFTTVDTTRRPPHLAVAAFADGREIPLVILGASPLHAAAFYGRSTEVDSLIDHGADPAALNDFNMSPLDVALFAGQEDAGVHIIRHTQTDSALLTGALRWAIPYGRWRVLAALLDRGVSPNAAYDRWHTPLIGVVENPFNAQFVDRREFRLDLLPVDPPDPRDPPYASTPLRTHESIVEGVRLLLDRGANPNQIGPEGFTALHEIATLSGYGGPIEAARLLIERGADLSVRARKGNTPLHTLVGRSPWWWKVPPQTQQPMLELFVAHTKDLDPRNAAGFTPVERAIVAHSFWAAQYLVEHGASDTTVFFGHTVREIMADAHKNKGDEARFKFEGKLERHYHVTAREPLSPDASDE